MANFRSVHPNNYGRLERHSNLSHTAAVVCISRSDDNPSESHEPLMASPFPRRPKHGRGNVVEQQDDLQSEPPADGGGSTCGEGVISTLLAFARYLIGAEENMAGVPESHGPSGGTEGSRMLSEANTSPSPPDSQDNISQARDPTLPRTTPLRKTLSGFDLQSSESAVVVCVIGIGNAKLPGPLHDLELLRKFHQRPELFYSIAAAHTTRGEVRQRIQQALVRACQVGTRCLVYFNGHSDNSNNFELSENQSLRIVDLLDWIDQYRTDKDLPVLVVFDHCRKEMIPKPDLPIDKLRNVDVFWTCSLGQKSHDLDLGNGTHYSQFMKAILLTLAKLPPNSDASLFVKELNLAMVHVSNIKLGLVPEPAGCTIQHCHTCGKSQLYVEPGHEHESTPLQTAVLYTMDNIKIGEFWSFIDPDARRVHADLIQENRWYAEFGSCRGSTLADCPHQV